MKKRIIETKKIQVKKGIIETKKIQVKKGIKLDILVACFLIVAFVALAGSLFTSRSVNSEWYQEIKPIITPPNWVFPVVWTILFILIAISLYLAWQKARNKKVLACLYGLNLDLNMAWSMLYFGLRNPKVAFYQIIVLWLSILLMIAYVWKIDRKASYLLAPYLLWVSFASALNFLSF